MANPLRGEVEFVEDGHTYVLVLGVNEICAAEGLLGRKAHEISAALTRGGDMSALRGVMWAALKPKHNLSLDESGRLLQAVGLAKATALMIEAMRLAFPEPEKTAANPRKAARGTGRRSTANG